MYVCHASGMFLRPDGSLEEIKADLIVGCDGAFSAIRKQFLRRSRFNYSQTYIPHGYMELTMPPMNGEVSSPYNPFLLVKMLRCCYSATLTVFRHHCGHLHVYVFMLRFIIIRSLP